jgi:GDP-4-dehydro-6-deoxy-D-mannose reductase
VNVLITGVTGFVGGHLVDLLRSERPDAALFGLARPRGDLMLPPGVRLVEADLSDGESVAAALEAARPELVFHLAGQSSVHQSWLDPAGTLAANLHGGLNLLEALRRLGLRPRVLVVGSADEYGPADPARQPLDEDAPLMPGSPYAVSKLAQGFLAREYARHFGIAAVRTRTFPHTGPGRGEQFAESSFARQIAEIETGLQAPRVYVGNLDAVRDFSDVRDVVRAYMALLERGEPGEVYNVCSGRGVAIRTLLDGLLALSSARVEVRVDPARLRPADIPALVGDPGRLYRATGFEPRIPLERTLADLLEHWRGRLRERAAGRGADEA